MSFIVGMVLFLFYLAFAPAGTRAFAGVSCYPWNGVVSFNIRPLRLVELLFLHEFHRWNGVVSFLSWPLRLLGLVRVQGFHAIVGMVLFFLISGLCAWWSLCFYMSFIVGMVLFLFYLAFAPAGTRAFAGVSCYPWNGVVFFNIRPLRLVELLFLHEFHRWNGVVSFLSGLCACWDSCVCRGFMLRPAVAPGGARVFTWVSSLGWCCVLIPGRCACWDWCVVLRLLRGLFFPCSSLQLCFPEFVSPKVVQTFLCRCFWKNWFPPVSLLIFSSQFVSGLSTAIWLLLSDRSACCTRAFAWFHALLFTVSSKLFCSGGFLPLFSSGVVCPDVSPNVSVQMFFRRFFVH